MIKQKNRLLRLNMDENLDKSDQTVRSLIFYGFCFICIFYIAYKWIEDVSNEKSVRGGYRFTQGRIISYWDKDNSDAGSGRSITYSYVVNSKVYSRDVYTQVKFPECDDEIGVICSSMRFWVAYSIDDESRSLINFKFNIQYSEKPVVPRNLKDFI